MTPRPARTVYLVDDNAEFRSSAQWWLSGAGYRVHDFGDAQTALDALDRLAAERPDELHRACLLLDVRMPGLSGLDLHDRLADRGLTLRPDLAAETPTAPPSAPPLPVVYMTGHGDVPLAVAAMQKGAVTMLEKPFADDALEQALERAFALAESAWARCQVASVFTLPPPDVAAPGLMQMAEPDPGDSSRREYQRRLDSLSPRQRQVLQGIVAGKLSKQIAWEIGLSGKTVEFHRKCLMERMQARNAMHLLRMAVSRSVDVADTLVA
ncbi:DNA-binding response regulator [Rubrivivax gelatinosus]|nr:DNA-binding response regulator [Rubrivivax gelatinosus]